MAGRARLIVSAAEVVKGDLLELPISKRLFPVGRVTRYPDSTLGLFWRERPGKRWAEEELGGVFHKQPDDLVAIHR